MATWEKQNSMLFIDTSETPSAPDWARLRKSTVFDLAFNPEVETLDFIDQQFPATCSNTINLRWNRKRSWRRATTCLTTCSR